MRDNARNQTLGWIKTTDTRYSERPAFNTPPCYEPRGEEAQDRGREEEPVEPVWSESAVHSMGATILDPKASSNAGEPIEASEAGEPMGTEQVENAVSYEMAPSVAGDIAEARAEVKSRIETSAAGELAEARAAGGPAEACAAGAADASATGTASVGRASRRHIVERGDVERASRRCMASRRRIAERDSI